MELHSLVRVVGHKELGLRTEAARAVRLGTVRRILQEEARTAGCDLGAGDVQEAHSWVVASKAHPDLLEVVEGCEDMCYRVVEAHGEVDHAAVDHAVVECVEAGREGLVREGPVHGVAVQEERSNRAAAAAGRHQAGERIVGNGLGSAGGLAVATDKTVQQHLGREGDRQEAGT